MGHDAPFLGRGWTFPPVFNAADASLSMVAGVENIAQSLNLLLATLQGSRALLPDFGSNLNQFVFRRSDAQTLEELAEAARFILLHGEPRIVVEDVRSQASADGSLMQLVIAYRVTQTNTRHNHVYPFASLEGSNLAPPPKAGIV
ncbi:MAG: GPW/gp25 family protein [Niveispirillum sp.]|uniref:GPW/gp25 family protein n=1 Tax=Niveispirillum sp. TaxID=1917217 RepID=UPI003BA77AC8